MEHSILPAGYVRHVVPHTGNPARPLTVHVVLPVRELLSADVPIETTLETLGLDV